MKTMRHLTTGIEDVGLFILLVLLFPVVILLIGAPVVALVWLASQAARAL